MRIGQTSIVVFCSKIAIAILGFVATIYFARVLGAEVLGYFAAIMSVTEWLQIWGKLGVNRSVTKRISEGEENSQYFSAGLLLVLALGVVTSVLTWAFRKPIDAYIGVDAAAFVIVILVTTLFYSIVSSALKGERLVHIWSVLNTGRVGLRSLFQIAFVFAGLGLAGMVFGVALSAFIIGIVGLFIISSSLTRPESRHFRSLFDFAKYVWIGNMRKKSFSHIDVLVLTAMVNPVLVGIYSIAWGIANVLKTFGAALRDTMFPEISKASEEADESLIRGLISDGIAYGGLLIIPGLFGGVLLADRLLKLYGEQFQQGATVLVLLILTALVDEYHQQLLNTLDAVNRPDLSFRINVVVLTMNIGGNIALVYLFGWVGAAVATVIAASTGLVLAYWALRMVISFELPVGELGRQFIAALAMTVVVIGGRELLENVLAVKHNAAILGVLVFIGASIYFVVLVSLSKRFRNDVVTNLPVHLVGR
jgi:O-antigen/teichoic acid export membrane protein